MNARTIARGSRLLVCALAMALSAVPSPAEAATFTVNTTDDLDDGACTASHCSLREAIHAADGRRGPDTIAFSIPGPGPHVIAIEGRPPISEHAPPGFTLHDDGTVIDGTTQPGYAGVPLIVLDGSRSTYTWDTGTLMEELTIRSSGCTVRGLSFIRHPGNAIAIESPAGSDNLIEDNYIGLDPGGNAQGNETGIHIWWFVGANTIRNNVISGNQTGIRVESDMQVIQGNLIGLDPTGTAARGNAVGIRLLAGGNWVGGTGAGQGNTISGNTQTGLLIDSFNNVVAGNRIGTNAAATAAIPNEVGILIDRNARANDIGLDLPGSTNIISGNVVGIRVRGEQTSIVDNRIGTDGRGMGAIPNQTGIILLGSRSDVEDNWIGNNTSYGVWIAGSDLVNLYTNYIYRNGQDGVIVGDPEAGPLLPTNGAMIRENAIFRNGGLGIRFAWPGVNGGIEPPVLTHVTQSAAIGTACPSCRVELFVADQDPSGFGEGKTLVASVLASADGTFSATFVEAVGSCRSITATATDSDRNTSEFAQNVDAGFCFRFRAILLIPWFLLPGAAGSAFMIVLNRLLIARRRPGWQTLLWGGLGAVFGAGLMLLILALPMVELQSAAPQPAEQPGPGAAPPQLEGPSAQDAEVITPTTVEDTRTPEPVVLTPTPSPTFPPPVALLRQNANCRAGQGTIYDVLTSLTQGMQVPIVGRDAGGNWLQVEVPGLLLPCWVHTISLDVTGDVGSVPVLEAPPTPTSTPTPVQACWVWNGNVNVCTAPCPPNAQPGGACTPP